MGFAPAAEASYDADPIHPEWWNFHHGDRLFPLGVPARVLRQWNEDKKESDPTPEDEFRFKVYPLPDGSVELTPRQEQIELTRRMRAMLRKARPATDEDVIADLSRQLEQITRRNRELEQQAYTWRNAPLTVTGDSLIRAMTGGASLSGTYADSTHGLTTGTALQQLCAGELVAVGASGVGVASPLGRALQQQGSSLKA